METKRPTIVVKSATGYPDVLINAPYGVWQSITTAPKDGTAILVGWWDGCNDWNAVTVVWSPLSKGSEYGEWTVMWCVAWLDRELAATPTHWQPLPEPPETKGTEV